MQKLKHVNLSQKCMYQKAHLSKRTRLICFFEEGVLKKNRCDVNNKYQIQLKKSICCRDVKFTDDKFTIVTRNENLVWKHGPDWSFYAVMLRTKLCWNPFFFTGHQNVNKKKSRAARIVCRPIFLPFYNNIVSFYFIFLSKCKQNKIKLWYNRYLLL